jgi:hypothetical protein
LASFALCYAAGQIVTGNGLWGVDEATGTAPQLVHDADDDSLLVLHGDAEEAVEMANLRFPCRRLERLLG